MQVRPLQVHLSQTKLTVDVGKKAELHCSVLTTQGADINWLKNGKEIEGAGTQSNRRIRYVNEMKTLVISRVQEGDDGMYQCFAKTLGESAQGAARLILGGEHHLNHFIAKVINLKEYYAPY